MGIFLEKSNRLNFILISSPINPTHYARLHPQNGERIVTIDAVTSFHPLYCALYKYLYLLTLTLGIFERLVSDIYAALLCVAYDAVCCYRCSVVCLSVCLSRTRAVLKRWLNQPICHLECRRVHGVLGTMYYVVIQIPRRNGQFQRSWSWPDLPAVDILNLIR